VTVAGMVTAAVLIVVGVALISIPAGLIAAGLAVAVLTGLLLVDVGGEQ
jgi:hypothetical protein